MLSVMFINKSVKNYLEVPDNCVVRLESGLDADSRGMVCINITNPFTSEGWNHYSDEIAYVMNDKGNTIASEKAPRFE